MTQPSKISHRLSALIGYATTILTLVLLFFFLIYPVGLIIKKAFVGQDGFTLEYFALLFSSELQTESIRNSLLIGIATTIFASMLSLPLAYLNSRYDYRGKNFLGAWILVPMIMPPFVGAIGMQRFFARFGTINMLLMNWGWIDTPIDWLGSENSFWAVVILEVLHLYPIMYLNLVAAFSNIDPSLEEAATIMGVSKWRQFFQIAWPLARPGFLAGAIIVFIWALTDLGTPLLVGFHETIPVHIFNMVTDINENPMGYALVFIVILLSVSFFLISKFFVDGKKVEMLGRGHVSTRHHPPGFVVGSSIYALFIGVGVVALLPHVTVLITSLSDNWFMTPFPEHYTFKYYQMIFDQELALIGIKNSFLFSSLSTLFDLVLGLLIAYIVTRKLIPFAAWLDALVMIPLALPGIVIAFGYIIAYSDTFLDPLRNPVPLLVIAYGIRRLPYMVRSASAGLQQTSFALEEASSLFGASKFHTLRKITLPLVMANLIAGGLLCFSYAMLDVSDSLILAMKDQFYPLTKVIYALYLEQGSGEFLASSLGVIAMLILALCIMGASLILGKRLGELFRS